MGFQRWEVVSVSVSVVLYQSVLCEALMAFVAKLPRSLSRGPSGDRYRYRKSPVTHAVTKYKGIKYM